MTHIKNDDGLLPCDSNHILTATEKNLRKEVEMLDALVSHYDALCERLSHENMVLKRHNPQPTEEVQAALNALNWIKDNSDDPQLNKLKGLYIQLDIIRNALMKGAQ